jgi:two-component system chemotaxis response regulator CheB
MGHRILLVDDAAVLRKLVGEALAADSQVEVVGTAPNGRIALTRIPQLDPELVILDQEMPEMDGLATLIELRRAHPKLPVIFYTSHSADGARGALDALHRGANDFVTKPVIQGGMDLPAIKARIRDDLIPRILALCRPVGELSRARPAVRSEPHPEPRHEPLPTPAAPHPVLPARPAAPVHAQPSTAVVRRATPAPRPAAAAPAPPPGPRPPRTRRIDAVLIGVSTGGPNALAEVVPHLDAQLGVPVLIVQHMPPMFTRMLAERLAQTAKLPVHEGAAGAAVLPNTVWIAPGDFHMEAERRGDAVVLALNQHPPENSCRPAVDPLFRSAAKVWGGNVLAVILTGMGQDGLKGCEHLAPLGAWIMAQDAATSVVWGMPGAVARAGLPDAVLPLPRIAAEINRLVAEHRGGRR